MSEKWQLLTFEMLSLELHNVLVTHLSLPVAIVDS